MSDNYEEEIRRAIIDQFEIIRHGETQFAVDVPVAYPDGDYCRVLVSRNNDGSWRVGDNGTSISRAGVSLRIGKIFHTALLQKANKIAAYYGLEEANGEIVRAKTDDLGEAIFAVAQASIQIVSETK